ncbi:hypothetical protein D3C81_2175930 [compost metagenome]
MHFGIINGKCEIIAEASGLQVKLKLQINVKALAQLALLFKHSVIAIVFHAVQCHFIHAGYLPSDI